MAFAEDYHDKIVARTINILRVSEGSRKKVEKFLNQMEKSLVADIRTAGDKSAFTQTRLNAQLGQVQKTIDRYYGRAEKSVMADLVDLGKQEYVWAGETINGLINVPLMTTAVTAGQIQTLVSKTITQGAVQSEWWNRQRKDIRRRYETTMREGIFRGETNEDLVRRVRGTRSRGYSDGIMSVTRREAMTLVRTSAITVANQSRELMYKSNQDVVKGIQWVSTLDHRTTNICRSLDGLQWDMKKNPIGHDKIYPGPTAHWACRSTQISILKSWDELAKGKIDIKGKKVQIERSMRARLRAKGLKESEIDSILNKTRASMDGQVASDMNFEDWLRKKDKGDPKFVDVLLGRGRVKLWRDGKITAYDLTDQRLRPLTVAELKAKHG
jgi:SPP1 gp7 family putative phage head morphogenesis protein